MIHFRPYRKLARTLFVLGGLGGTVVLAGCGLDVQPDYLQKISEKEGDVYQSELKNQNDSIFGKGGLDLFNFGAGKRRQAGAGAGLGVNSFLWRASLDTIAFMPLASADPFGGVIITDWYTPPEAPKERYKMSVYILGRELRADGVKVAVFRQRINGQGSWIDTTVAPETATNLENQILTRARQLRIASNTR